MAETGRTEAGAADAIGADILAHGQKMMASRLAEAMPGVLEKMDVSLFDLSEQSADGELKRFYQALQRDLRERRNAIVSAFPQALQAEFAEIDIANSRAAGGKKSDAAAMALSLVEFDDMEESLGVSGLASSLRNTCTTELRDLGIRVAHLLSLRDLRDRDNPFGPTVIASAFKRVLAPIDGIKSRLTLLQLIGNLFPETLSAFYGELNGYFVSRGIVPEIKYRAKASGAPTGRTPMAGASSGSRISPAETGRAGGVSLPEGEGADMGDLFASLQQLVMMNMARSGPHGMAMFPQGADGLAPGKPNGMGSLGGGFPSAHMSMQATDELLKSLTNLQHAEIDSLPGSGADVGGAFEPSQLDLGTANLLRNIRDAGLYNPASQVDAITIDVVAMLFDFVFEDTDIPAAVRVLIGRLQIPVLKAAILDKKFFSKRDNSARKLLDKLAQVSVAWSGKVSEEDPLYQRIAAVVSDVIDNFEEDSSVFERAIEQLEQYIAEEESQAEEHSKNTAETLCKREVTEFAKVLAHEEVAKRAGDVPQEIQQFLMNYWLDVLVTAYESDGEESGAWKSGLELVDDLSWSVEPKIHKKDRQRLLHILPQLLKRIEDAMRFKSATDDEVKAFSSKLVEFHITALKGLPQLPEDILPTEQPEMEVSPSTVEPEVEPLEIVSQEESDSGLVGAPAASAEGTIGGMKWTFPTKDLTEEDDYDRMVKQLQKGCWLEFTLEDGTRLRVKLIWVSPMKGVMLFTERDGSNAVKISPKSLARRFRDGTVAVLGDTSLVERAVGNVMNQLMKNTGAEVQPLH